MQKDGSVTIESIAKNGRWLPKGIEVPDSWKNIKVNDTACTISEEEWKFIDSIITDMSPEEKEEFIAELELIFEGTSTLPIEMQQKVISRFGGYLINATEGQSGGPAPLWMEYGGHDRMSEADGVNLGYVTENHINTLMDYSIWADENRMQPPLPLLVQNRHSWVFNDTPIPFCDNYGPDSLEYFTSEAKTNFNNYNTEAAYVSIAKGLHYIEDLGNPFHTSSLYAQERHSGCPRIWFLYMFLGGSGFSSVRVSCPGRGLCIVW